MTKDCSWNYHENYKHRTCCALGNFMNNPLPYCGLIDANKRGSEKDLPVLLMSKIFQNCNEKNCKNFCPKV